MSSIGAATAVRPVAVSSVPTPLSWFLSFFCVVYYQETQVMVLDDRVLGSVSLCLWAQTLEPSWSNLGAQSKSVKRPFGSARKAYFRLGQARK